MIDQGIDNLTGRELDARVAEAIGIKTAWHKGRLCRAGFEGNDWSAASRRADIPDYCGSTDFHLVKREIERRGWGWSCERDCDPSLQYRFVVHAPTGNPGEYCRKHSAWAESEEVAGCRAFLMASMVEQDISQKSREIVTMLSEMEKKLESIDQPHEWIIRIHPSLNEFVMIPEVREHLEEMGIKVIFEVDKEAL